MERRVDREHELEGLYRRRFGAFRRGASGVTGDDDLAWDAVQEAFARALAGLEGYRGDAPLEVWVWRIVVRTAREMVRRAPRAVGEVGLALDDAASPELAAAVRSLAPRRRLVVFLRYYADLSYADIADVTGMATGTVSATLAQARAALLEALTTPNGVEHEPR
jgi:RNA polymerase sigma factor (sigma-70 family)